MIKNTCHTVLLQCCNAAAAGVVVVVVVVVVVDSFDALYMLPAPVTDSCSKQPSKLERQAPTHADKL